MNSLNTPQFLLFNIKLLQKLSCCSNIPQGATLSLFFLPFLCILFFFLFPCCFLPSFLFLSRWYLFSIVSHYYPFLFLPFFPVVCMLTYFPLPCFPYCTFFLFLPYAHISLCIIPLLIQSLPSLLFPESPFSPWSLSFSYLPWVSPLLPGVSPLLVSMFCVIFSSLMSSAQVETTLINVVIDDKWTQVVRSDGEQTTLVNVITDDKPKTIHMWKCPYHMRGWIQGYHSSRALGLT